MFVDNNGNGIRDLGETGVAQVLLFLRDENVLSDGDGKFEFTPLGAGEHPFYVDVATLPAYLGIAKELLSILSVRRGSVISLQIPVVSIGSIEGYVFRDVNSNAKFDPEEKGLPTIRVIVQNDKGQEWEAFTNNDGYYAVTDLLQGIYTVMIDSRWLPKRILPGRAETILALTPDAPNQTSNLATVKEKLKIKKTFIAPKKKKD